MALLNNILTQGTAQRFGWMLVHFVWQAAIVALVLAILLKLLRKSSANLRYIVACLALITMVLLPAVTMNLIPVDESYSPVEVAVTPTPAPVAVISTPVEIEPFAGTEIPVNIEIPAIETEVAAQIITASPAIPLKQRITQALEPNLP